MTPDPEPIAQLVADYAEQVRRATIWRDGWIRKMRAEGASWRQIATAAGMSHRAIQKIVAKGEPQ